MHQLQLSGLNCTAMGRYGDFAIQEDSKEVDIATARQILLAKKLNEIQMEVAESRAQVTVHADSKRVMTQKDLLDGISLTRSTVGAKGTAEANDLDGDDYIKVRVNPMLKATTHDAKVCIIASCISTPVYVLWEAAGT